MNIAVGEWGWIHKNCMKGIRKPDEPEPRKRRPTDQEITLICKELGYRPDAIVSTIRQRVAVCFLFALETAMRASEITNLKRSEVFFSEGYIKVTGEELTAKKTRSAIRSVPLTAEAKRLISQIYNSPNIGKFLFGVRYHHIGGLFYEAVQKANVFDLKFHDSRHEGITRLARIYKVLDLARIIGHRDIQGLMVYYNPTIEELVSRMPKA